MSRRFIRGALVIAAALLAGCTVELPAPQYPTAGIGSGGTYRPPPVSPPAPLYPPPAPAEPEPQPPYADEPPAAVQHPWARTPAPVTQPDDPPAVAQSPQPALRYARSLEKKQARADDARRKIIAGALALEHFAKNPDSEFGKIMFRLLDEYARPDERFLFEFLPVRDQPKPDLADAAE